ncbi:uncharacterized protein RCO7_03146 [Rhynchosporium graminicola]|uniref:Uncharacterized protein n=1 Tax=Rhynchosporium graminicola TaxID=2792576 RepID=A0A1E1KS34_9HELO|nr:uncharacterized protein RCO7_03146 [Rhynchosporium commune]
MDVPLAFYVITVLLNVPLMFMAIAGANSKRRRRIYGAAAFLTGSPSVYKAGNTDIWRINVTDVSLGTMVLGLTWAGVGALMIEFGVWMWSFAQAKTKTLPAYEVKQEQDGYLQG